MSEYDARSKAPNKAFRDNYDKVFGKKKKRTKPTELCTAPINGAFCTREKGHDGEHA